MLRLYVKLGIAYAANITPVLRASRHELIAVINCREVLTSKRTLMVRSGVFFTQNAGMENMAFVFLNRYLDISEVG